MTLPAPPAIGSGGFRGVLVPADVQQRIINTLIEQTAFANSISRLPTRSGSVAFPVASPEGAAWISELAKIPLMSLNDRAEIVAVAKLAGLLDVSNEMISDAAISVTAQFTTLLRDSLSKQLDQGLLFGAGPPEPTGVVAAAPEISGSDLLEAVLAARGSINDAGGAATTLAASGATLAAADGARDGNGALMVPGGFSAVTGLIPVTVPGLDPPLVYDRTRMYLILRDDASVEMSRDFRFDFDATTFRVRARVACACPDPGKTLRKLAVSAAGPDVAETPADPGRNRPSRPGRG
jgi:HK97 family phage major capsid protein